MKNSITKYLPLLFIFLFTACEFEDIMSDDELIDAIINAEEKVQILESDLPIDAKNTMSSDIPDDFFDKGSLASQLGYQINMRSFDFFFLGVKSDDIFFDLSGRELFRTEGYNKSDDKKDDDGKDDDGKDDKSDKDGKKDGKKDRKKNCFYLEYPVSLELPDGSTIKVNDKKEAMDSLKKWYSQNPDVKEKANLVFPVSIYWVEKKEKTKYDVESEIEMKELFAKCKGSKDKEKKD
tara:strand:- start:413 stop:1120 length:708 start_codon:yes stop_codon:yes gene_type:complete